MTDEPLNRVRKAFSRFKDLANQISYTDMQTSLPGLLTMSDRASSAYSIENRSPFLDYRIIEFSYQIPPKFKIKDGRTKYIIHKVAEGIVPKEIVERKEKIGFVVPINHWFANSLKAWKAEIIDNLHKRNCKFINTETTNGRGEFDRKLYHMIGIELWHRQFVDN